MKEKYRVGEVARIKGVDAQTLRYYDKLDILTPAFIEENRYRYYSVDQFMDVDFIKFCKKMGFTLGEIKEFKEITDIDQAMAFMKEKRDEFEKEVLRKQAILKNFNQILDKVELVKNKYEQRGEEPQIVELEDLYVVEGECNTTDDWFQFEKKLCDLTDRYPNYNEIGHNATLILKYDYNEEESDARHIDKILLPIDKKYKDDINVERWKLGRCVLVLYKDPSHDKSEIIMKIRSFVEQQGLTTRGEIFIQAVVGKFIVNNIEERLVEIIVPIK